MTKVCLSGYYGFDNMGNDVIMVSIIAALQNTMENVEIIVLSDNPEKTAADYGVTAYDCWQYRSIVKAIRQCDVLISGGGNLLKDSSGTKFIRHYLRVMRMAARRKKAVFVFAQRVGPIESKKLQNETVKTLRKATKVTVRDEASARLLQKWGFRKGRIRVTADPIFLFDQVSREWRHDEETAVESAAQPVAAEDTAVAIPVAAAVAAPAAVIAPDLTVTPAPADGDTTELPAAAELPVAAEDTVALPEEAVVAAAEPEPQLYSIKIQIIERHANPAEPEAVAPLYAAVPAAEPEIAPAISEEETIRPATADPARWVTEDTIRLDLPLTRSRAAVERTVQTNAALKAQALAELNAEADHAGTQTGVDADEEVEISVRYAAPEDTVAATASEAVNLCPTCGQANPAGKRFCHECGNPLPLIETPVAEPAAVDNTPPEEAAPAAEAAETVEAAETAETAEAAKTVETVETAEAVETTESGEQPAEIAPEELSPAVAALLAEPHGIIGKGRPALWKKEGDRLAAFCLRGHRNLPVADMAVLADMVAKGGYRVIFLPFQFPEDIAIGKEVMAQMTMPAAQIEYLLNAKEMAAVFDQLDFVFSVRLHPLMMAAVGQIPFVALGGDAKIHDFMDSMGMSVIGDLADYDREELMTNMEQALTHTADIQALAAEHLPAMREKAEETFTLLVNSLRRKRNG